MRGAGLAIALIGVSGTSVGVAAAQPAGPAPGGTPGRILGTVTATESDGKPASAADVIVYVVGFTEPPGKDKTRIAQQGRKFVPDLVAITVNELVEFPNFDPYLHNVFSQSGPRKFDLGSFKRGESKEKQFPMPGVVDVYCNIHPEMAATILVLPNRRHVLAQADGRYTLEGVPPGDWTVFAYTRRATKPVSARVSVKPGADVTVDFSIVRGAEPAHLNKYGEKYKDGSTVYR